MSVSPERGRAARVDSHDDPSGGFLRRTPAAAPPAHGRTSAPHTRARRAAHAARGGGRRAHSGRCDALGRLLPAAGGRLPRPPLRAEPRLAARPDRGHARGDRPLRGAPHLRGRRAEAAARAGARPQRLRRRDLQRHLPVRGRHHRLGGRAPRAGALEPGAPRPARRLRPGHAGRPGGADRRAADRARRAQGDAERLPDRRARLLQRRRVRARAAPRRRGGAGARQRAHPRAPRARGTDRLAHRPLQPPLLPRAAAPRADPRLGRARERRRRDGRHRRLQEGQRRLRPRRRRRGARRARRPPARDRPRGRRRLPDRRRGVRRDRPGQPRAHTTALASRLAERLDEVELGLAGKIAVSIGIAQGPSTRPTRASSSPAPRRR